VCVLKRGQPLLLVGRFLQDAVLTPSHKATVAFAAPALPRMCAQVCLALWLQAPRKAVNCCCKLLLCR
jgi:hypothetical protein